jgi:hypothetical protein
MFHLLFSPLVLVPWIATSEAVYGDLSSLGVSQEALASASVAQESSESDADVQQILKDFKVWLSKSDTRNPLWL